MHPFKRWMTALLITSLPLTPGLADAATTSTATPVTVSATLVQSLSVVVAPTVAALGNVSVLGSATLSTPLTVTTTWSLNPGVTLTVYGYFSTATAALSDGSGHNIPSSAVLGSVDAGTATAFTQNSPFGSGSSLSIYSVPITSSNPAGVHVDTLLLSLNLAGAGNLPPATYNGTMYIEAQAL
jgi:hypothetical protein